MPPQLKKIADIQMGLSFRSRIIPKKDGNATVIQMRGLVESENHQLSNPRNLMTVHLKNIHPRHWVKRNDLVFRSRGKTTTTAIINTEIKRAVIAAPLLRIRVTSDKVLPGYLCWFINQPPAQAFLHSRATGSAMVTIGKAVLEMMEIPLPCVATQKQIIALAALSDKEQRLMAGIANQKKRLAGKILMQLAKQPETNHNQPGNAR